MKIYFYFFIPLFFFSCHEKETAKNVINKYELKAKANNKIQYDITRIDSFSSNDVWNRIGQVLIEKIKEDTLFGMSFFVESYSLNNSYLYHNYKSFEISNRDSNYELVSSYGFLGSPGGQMIIDDVFGLDSLYKTVSLVDYEHEYQLQFTFEDDTTFQINNIQKIININKTTFFPSKIIIRSEKLGEITSKTFLISKMLVNDKVTNSIENYKNGLLSLEIISNKSLINASLIGTEFIPESLPDLWNDKPIDISEHFPALISFWEVWCSPCVESLPKLKSLQKNYNNKISIIGISTESQEKTRKMLLSKKVEFINLKGTEKTLQNYNINSFPTYFLVDKNGIIIEEYFLYSDDIEKDIKAL